MTTQPLKWHGGKHYLAKRIIELFPPHLHYVEPYFGGGSVLLARDPTRDWFIDAQWKLEHGETVPASLRGSSEVVNDVNYQLTNFWRVLATPGLFDEFTRIIEATPFSQLDFRGTKGDCDDLVEEYPAQCAANFFTRYRQSRQGLGKDFATLSRNRTRRGMNEQVSSWLTAIDGLPEIHERLKRVVILNDDALKVIRSQDGDKTLYYLDPPYLHQTRHGNGANGEYEHEMTEQQHANLLLALTNISGKFVLSGYHSRLYDNHAKCEGWRCVEIEIDNKSSSKAVKDKKTECLWMNY